MTGDQRKVPVIDLFAGPGGLSEGFSRYSDFAGDDIDFDVRLSIEKDPVARRTLRLRAFARQFKGRVLPEQYYNFIRAEDANQRAHWLGELKKFSEWQHAENEAWQATLGDVDFYHLHSRIAEAIGPTKDWVLLGGPPCQAYSVIGRSRMTGLGSRAFEDENRESRAANAEELKQRRIEAFLKDHRHTLYREYLKIVAIHQPAMFVMENVRGILSSKIQVGTNNDGSFRYEEALGRIRRDLENPWKAVVGDPEYPKLKSYASKHRHTYSVRSFVSNGDVVGDLSHKDFLIRCEEYGVPQARHRVILFGVRDDVDIDHQILRPALNRVPTHSVIGDLPALRSRRSKGRDSSDEWQKAISMKVSDTLLEQIDDQFIEQRMRAIGGRVKVDLPSGGPFMKFRTDGPPIGGELARWIHDPLLGGVCQHEARSHMDTDLVRYLYVSAFGERNGFSPKLRHFPASLLPDHRNVKDSNGKARNSMGFHDRFRVQIGCEPATTVTSHIRKDGHYFIHYDPGQCRSLTVREAARLQTFADNYYFEGNRTKQYEQVGNAVPPMLAVQLAEVVADVLRKSGRSATVNAEDAA